MAALGRVRSGCFSSRAVGTGQAAIKRGLRLPEWLKEVGSGQRYLKRRPTARHRKKKALTTITVGTKIGYGG